MLFNTVQFFVFFAIVLALHYTLPRAARKYLLLAASYYFYGSWNPAFVPLLATITAVDYAAANWMHRFTSPQRRRQFLILSLAVNLGFLGFFKYYNFFGEQLAALLGRTPDAFALSILLPIGISFHTFQSMSYVIDVYRGDQKAIRNPVDYALFVAFFPQLVAGPIVRAHEFFDGFYNWRGPSIEERLRGVLWMLLGLAKKVVLADQFARISDSYFGNPAANAGALQAWSGAFAFAMQIFFDFSGYTDMAIGMALLLGYRFPINFARPYLAFSITDFWHRWHMTLSRWLRDYLYIPLGGNRGSRGFVYRNLFLTMLLGGLWHGAAWTFVVWGALHGGFLVVERIVKANWEPRGVRPELVKVGQWFLTFHLVCLAWIFFRAETFTGAMDVIQQILFAGGTGPLVTVLAAFTIAAMLASQFVPVRAVRQVEGVFAASPIAIHAVALGLGLLLIDALGPEGVAPFIYFQF